MPHVEFDDIEWDENNRWYATKRGITMDEIEQVIATTKYWKQNKRGPVRRRLGRGPDTSRAAYPGDRRVGPSSAPDSAYQRLGGGTMGIPPRPEGMSDEDWAEYVYEHRNDPVDPADIETLESAPSAKLSVNASVRLTPEEHQAVQQAAEASGMTISAYIRARVLDAGRAVDYSRVRADLDRINAALGDLREAIAT